MHTGGVGAMETAHPPWDGDHRHGWATGAQRSARKSLFQVCELLLGRQLASLDCLSEEGGVEDANDACFSLSAVISSGTRLCKRNCTVLLNTHSKRTHTQTLKRMLACANNTHIYALKKGLCIKN